MSMVTIGSASHKGLVKKENQDYHSWRIPEDDLLSTKGILLALADGMGGRTGGSTASKTAVDTLIGEYYKDDSSSIQKSLEIAFAKANKAVIEKGKENIETEGMASTLVSVVLLKDEIYYAHVGDSRGYIIFENEISQFTEDHSFVASLVKAGAISKEEAENHPEKNIITRAIGLEQDLKVDTGKIDHYLRKDQYILLCCDGLHGVVSDPVILMAVNKYKEPDVTCEKLIEKANQNGGPDNITVIIARIDKVNIFSSLTSRIKNFVR